MTIATAAPAMWFSASSFAMSASMKASVSAGSAGPGGEDGATAMGRPGAAAPSGRMGPSAAKREDARTARIRKIGRQSYHARTEDFIPFLHAKPGDASHPVAGLRPIDPPTAYRGTPVPEPTLKGAHEWSFRVWGRDRGAAGPGRSEEGVAGSFARPDHWSSASLSRQVLCILPPRPEGRGAAGSRQAAR